RLPYGLRPLDHVIDKTEVVLSFGRLKISPGPSDVSDGRARVLVWRQWIPNAEMKVGEPHSGIKEDLVDCLWVDGHCSLRDRLAVSLRRRTVGRKTGASRSTRHRAGHDHRQDQGLCEENQGCFSLIPIAQRWTGKDGRDEARRTWGLA